MKNEEVPYYSYEIKDVLKKLKTKKSGLSSSEALKRLDKYGYNELKESHQKSIFSMLIEQLSDAMVIVLIIASILSIILGELTEALVIIFIVVLDAIIGIVQEKKARDAILSLKKLSSRSCRVLRDNEEMVIPTSYLTVGDIVLLEDGIIIPADMRLISSSNLKVEESSLTGESVPVLKEASDIVSKDEIIGNRTNMVYSSTIVIYGNGVGVVTAIGNDTLVGNIASMLKDDNFETPIKRKLNSVGKILSIVGIIVCLAIFLIGLLYKRDLLPLIMTSISLAISIIPEGLPATATIVMALGVLRMARQNALVRKLPAVETLGSATVICTDKTGTLTENKMTVTELAIYKDFLNEKAQDVCDIKDFKDYENLIISGALCNNATIDSSNNVLGDPTEGALILLALKFGFKEDKLESTYPKVFEQPFDSIRKRMTTVHSVSSEFISYTKGAVDELLSLCTYIETGDGIKKITSKDIEDISNLYLSMSNKSLRVLGFAKKVLKEIPKEDDDVEFDMVFIGIMGMIDPPKKEVLKSIEACHNASIKTIMITGDHKVTAMAIASKLNIYKKGDIVLSGDELAKLSDEMLDKKIQNVSVFARVSPKDKLRIIKSLKRNNEVVAMTGDGVNDAPALKAADIGIAMGLNGTDVAKDSADMILMDDNFKTIEIAIKEGRRIYNNIQKVIQFLLSGNIAEMLTLFIAILFNWEAPILAVHILLINLVTDTIPALALGVDPANDDIMDHKPIRSNSLFEKGLVFRVILYGIFITICTIISYKIGLNYGSSVAMTMTFCVLSISQLFNSLNQRSNIDFAFSKKNERNFVLFITLLLSAFILVLVLFVPLFRSFFSLTVLSFNQWLIVLLLSFTPFMLVEFTKLIKRMSLKR